MKFQTTTTSFASFSGTATAAANDIAPASGAGISMLQGKPWFAGGVGVGGGSRTGVWELCARYDTVETAMAAARAAGGKGKEDDDDDDKDEGKAEDKKGEKEEVRGLDTNASLCCTVMKVASPVTCHLSRLG